MVVHVRNGIGMVANVGAGGFHLRAGRVVKMEHDGDAITPGACAKFSQRGILFDFWLRIAVEEDHQRARLGPLGNNPPHKTRLGFRWHAVGAVRSERYNVGGAGVLGGLFLTHRLGRIQGNIFSFFKM